MFHSKKNGPGRPDRIDRRRYLRSMAITIVSFSKVNAILKIQREEAFAFLKRGMDWMPRRTDARRRALEAAERLFRKKGYSATGLAEILKASGAPKGSFYFHFPDGKVQVGREVLAAYSARVASGLKVLANHHLGEPNHFVAALCKSIDREMQDSGWALGCAVQNVAAEAGSVDQVLLQSAAKAFESWLEILASALGGPKHESRRAALRLLAALEGARTLARASRSSAPFDAIAEFDWTPRPNLQRRAGTRGPK
jgi:TetR/AcrR family transcriptional repressor of lmrAB and yxaGH operons